MRGSVHTSSVLLLTKQHEQATEYSITLLQSYLFLKSVQDDNLCFDEEDILKVFLIAFSDRIKKKQL